MIEETKVITEQIPLWVYIIVSAATGAVASAVLNLFGQWRDRIGRRKELILKTATELAFKNNELVMQIAKDTYQTALIPSHILLVADYYKSLKHLIDKNDLPEESKFKRDEKDVEGLKDYYS